MYYAFSLLIEPLANASGVGRGEVVGAFSVGLLANGLASRPVGRLIDRHGGRRAMTIGSLASAALLAMLAHVGNAWQLYAVWALLGLAMSATLYDPAFAVLGQVFKENQRKAITALTLFGGFASTVFWPLTQALVTRYGWQHALHLLGAANLLVCAPLHWWMLPKAAEAATSRALPAAKTSAPAPLFRDPAFIWLCVAFTGNALVFSAMSVHLLPLLHAKGLTLTQAAWIGALIGPMQVLGRILEFSFLSHWSSSRIGVLAMWLLPLSLGTLAFTSPHLAIMAFFALIYGSGNGVMTIVRGAIPAELYGRERYGEINGAMATPIFIAKAAGPVAAAVVLAVAQRPDVMLLAMAAVGAASALLFSATVRHKRARALSARRLDMTS